MTETVPVREFETPLPTPRGYMTSHQRTPATSDVAPAPVDETGAGGTPALAVHQLVRAYRGTVAVDHASVEVAPGEVVTLLGPSGCGKSTLLRAVAGIDRLDGGTISIGGRIVADHQQGTMVPSEKRHVGMVFQSYALWPHLSVLANVEFPLRRRGISTKERRRRALEALDSVHLGGLDRRYPGELSGGQQQRVSLARAIVGDPQVLLMDEPLSNLDAQLRDAMRIEIKRVQQERHLSVLYVTHDQQEALALSDRIVVMRAGRVLQEGHPEDIYTNPASAYAARFLGASNLLSATAIGPESVRLADGTSLPVRQHELVPGAATVVRFRPSAVRFERPGSDEQVLATVEQCSFLGTGYETELRLRTGETVIAASADPPPDDDVALRIVPAYAFADDES